ncbi:MAG: hypothetical protein LBU18_06080 [Treponema sp.]|nr:hypothetical protein [Treponema sp.]
MKGLVIMALLLSLSLAGCNNAVNPESGPPAESEAYTIDYSAGGPGLSKLLGWQWAKEGSDFIWLFRNDGTVSVIHCCGEVYHRQFSYLFLGNIFITYGHETSFDELDAGVFTMTEDAVGVSLARSGGMRFVRGEPDAASLAAPPLVLSNDLLGTWRGEDGTEYEFRSDAGLFIRSPDGYGQYAYLVRYAELLILGPLVDGAPATLRRYRFNRSGGKLYLRGSDGQKYTLNALK